MRQTVIFSCESQVLRRRIPSFLTSNGKSAAPFNKAKKVLVMAFDVPDKNVEFDPVDKIRRRSCATYVMQNHIVIIDDPLRAPVEPEV